MKDNEAKLLRDKCILFNQFMIEHGQLPESLADGYRESSRLIEDAFDNGKTRQLKVASADIDDQILRHMPIEMASEFKKIFLSKLGIKYNIIENGRLADLNKIIKSGVIGDLADRELVLNRIDEIYSDNENKTELDILNELLLKFEKKFR